MIWERNQTIWYILVSMAVVSLSASENPEALTHLDLKLAPATMVGFIVWSQDKYVWLPNPMPG